MTDSKAPLAFSRPEIVQDDIDAVVRVLESGWITTGEETRKFEHEMSEYLGVKHVIAVSSATTALEIALVNLKLDRGSPVAVPAWTFVSSALAIERAGYEPVLIDVDPTSLNVCPLSLQAVLESGVSAVVGVHFAGTPMAAEIRKICEQFGAPLVEDAAHAFGTVDDRGLVAGQGTAGACFSFYATKNLTTAEGGAIGTDNDELAEFARVYRLHGMSADAIDRYRRPGYTGYDVSVPGLKANLPDVLSALGRSQLKRFEATQDLRRALASGYRAHLAGDDRVTFIPGLQHSGSAEHLVVVDLNDADRQSRVIESLSENNIGSSVHFTPLHKFSWFRNAKQGPGGLPTSDEMDGRVMSLPLHPNMTMDDVDRVSEIVKSAL